MTKNKPSFIKSFTLIEMLAVITIIAVLSGIFVAHMSDSRYQAEFGRAKAFSLSLVTGMPADFLSEWKFEGPTPAGSTVTANDVKDTWFGNDGTVNSAPVVRDGSNCVSGKCIQLDGTDDYISHAAISFHATPTAGEYAVPHTFSVWTKWSGSSSPGRVIPFGSSTINNNNIYYKDTVAYNFLYRGFSQSNPTAVTNSDTTVLFDGKWHFVVWTIDSTPQIKLFIDGKQNGSTTAMSNPEIDYNGIGRGYTSNAYNWNGLIDDLRVYTTTLTIAETKENYFAGINKLIGQSINKEEYVQRIVELINNNLANE